MSGAEGPLAALRRTAPPLRCPVEGCWQALTAVSYNFTVSDYGYRGDYTFFDASFACPVHDDVVVQIGERGLAGRTEEKA